MSKEIVTVENRKVSIRESHRLFERAFIAAGCPPRFKWGYDQKLKRGIRVMDLLDRKRELAEAELPTETRKKLIETRRAEYELKKQRQRIKEGL